MFDLFSSFHPRTTAHPACLPSEADSAATLPDLARLPIEAVTGERQIASILRGLAEARRTVQLSSLHLKASAITRLLGVDVSRREAFIRQLDNETEHTDLVRDVHINLMSRHGDTPLMGSVDLLRNGVHEGTPCYVVTLPPYLLLFEMRSSPRVHATESRHTHLGYAHPAEERLLARVTDMSEGGLGLVLLQRPLCRIALHDRWPKARLGGREGEIGVIDLEMHRITPLASGELHLGTAIVDASESTRQRLRRLILRLQSRSPLWS